MAERLRWDVDGRDWPNRDESQFVNAAGIRWHVQRFGRGPDLLLLHGTGASTHTWRDLAPLLAQTNTVLALDLPGHAFTESLPAGQATLPGMAAAVAALLEQLGCVPEICVGHSAGAAIVARLCIDRRIGPRGVVSINGAMLPLPGWPGLLYSPMARLLASGSLASRLFAWRARDPAAVDRLIASTGSKLDPRGAQSYARLIRNPAHVAGALAMMAAWQLDGLERDLPSLVPPMLLIVGSDDRTVPPSEAERIARRVPRATIAHIANGGHLVHEEYPSEVGQRISEFAARAA